MNRITMISTLPPIKGLSPYTMGLCKELSQKVPVELIGFKQIYPEFLYPGGTRMPGAHAPRMRGLQNRSFLTWYNPFSWIYAGFSLKGDVVHAQWWSWFLAPIYLTVLGAARLRRKKIIITVHNVKPHEKSFLKNLLNNSVYRMADEYIVHSEHNKELFLKERPTGKPVHVVAHGLIPLPVPLQSRNALRTKYGYAHDDTVLLFFGNIRDYKGLDVLLRALKAVPDAKLMIAGSPWGGFEKYDLLIDELKLRDRVSLQLKFIDDRVAGELFSLADLAVFPYREFEAASGAGSAALHFSLPIVVSNVGSLPDMVVDKNVIAKPADARDLTRAIKYSLARLPQLREDSRSLKKKYSWRRIAEQTMEVYE